MSRQRDHTPTKRPVAVLHRFRYAVLGTCLVAILGKPAILLGISGYQRFVSPYKGWCCAHAALHGDLSCSAYGKEVISRHGVLRGGLLLWKRFEECQRAADLAANSVADEAGKRCTAACQKSEKACADGCVRGCTGCLPRTTRKPSSVQSTTTSDASSTFVQPCPDAGGYRRFGWAAPAAPDRVHLGQDYNAPAETAVRAIADGIVVDVNLSMGGFGGSNPSKPGPMMWIRHRTSTGEYFHALYGHLSPGKRKGQWVAGGEVVGTILPFYDGSDYLPHLHLGIWQGKATLPPQQLGYGPQRSFVDPINFMDTHQPGTFGR